MTYGTVLARLERREIPKLLISASLIRLARDVGKNKSDPRNYVKCDATYPSPWLPIMPPEARTAAYKRHERYPGYVLVRLPSREWATVSKREALHSGMALYKNKTSQSITMSMSYFKRQ